MAASLSFNPPTRWSQCSINDVLDGFNNRNLDRCLFNEPTAVVGDPACGNGIQEEGEDCDCGSVQVQGCGWVGGSVVERSNTSFGVLFCVYGIRM